MRAVIVPVFLLLSVVVSGIFLASYHKKVLNSDYAKKVRNKSAEESTVAEIASFIEYSFSIFDPASGEHTTIAAGDPDTAAMDSDHLGQPNSDSQPGIPLTFRD